MMTDSYKICIILSTHSQTFISLHSAHSSEKGSSVNKRASFQIFFLLLVLDIYVDNRHMHRTRTKVTVISDNASPLTINTKKLIF